MKRIVLVIGGVETLEYFSYQMGKTFEEEGYLVYYFDLREVNLSLRKLRKFVRTGETVLITFNFEGLSKEPGIYKEGIGHIWEEYKMPCYNIAVDHPYYYHKRLVDLPKQYYHISIDRNHEQYFKEYYPEYTHLGFLPSAGTMLQIEDFNEEDERAMDVVLTGNYKELSFCNQFIYRLGDEYAAFYQGIIDELIACPHKTVEEVALAHCEKEMGKLSKEDARLTLHNMIFIDIFIRNYWRGEVVKTLVNAGIHVDVLGDGWDKLDCEKPEYLHIHPQAHSLVCLLEIRKAKVSLNVMPWFKDGAHDRIFNSILNGTVCVTDKSKYLCEELQEGEGVCYYDLENLAALPKIVSNLLLENSDILQKKDDELADSPKGIQNDIGTYQGSLSRQQIVERGMEKISNRHTWTERARQIIEWIG